LIHEAPVTLFRLCHPTSRNRAGSTHGNAWKRAAGAFAYGKEPECLKISELWESYTAAASKTWPGDVQDLAAEMRNRLRRDKTPCG
jgi:hypothetical protein